MVHRSWLEFSWSKKPQPNRSGWGSRQSRIALRCIRRNGCRCWSHGRGSRSRNWGSGRRWCSGSGRSSRSRSRDGGLQFEGRSTGSRHGRDRRGRSGIRSDLDGRSRGSGAWRAWSRRRRHLDGRGTWSNWAWSDLDWGRTRSTWNHRSGSGRRRLRENLGPTRVLLAGRQHGQREREHEQGDGQIHRAALKHVRCLRTDELGHGRVTKGSTEALLARALHEYNENEEEADDDFDHRENSDQDVHKGGRIWGRTPIWQAASQAVSGAA